MTIVTTTTNKYLFLFSFWFLGSILFLSLNSCSSARVNQEKAILHATNGTSYYQNSSYPMALKEFLKAEEFDPENSMIQNSLGLTYFMREKYDLSLKHFQKAIKIDPKFTDAKNNLARTLIEMNRFTEAEKELTVVLNDLTYPAQERAYINMGLCLFKQNKFDRARDNFLKAIDAQQDNCLAHTYYGRSYFELKDYESATSALDKAIEFCQKNLIDEPHYYSALAYYRLGKKEKAMARFQELIKLYPNGKYLEKSKGMLDILRKGN